MSKELAKVEEMTVVWPRGVEATSGKSSRLISLDALRGFDMLLISGGAAFLHLLHGKTNYKWIDIIAEQLEHPKWDGFTFYDFIFPLFLFISGVSLVYSLNSGIEKGSTKTELYKSMFKRMLILMALGIVYKNNPLSVLEPDQIRFGSVLGRIGIACFIATILYLELSNSTKLFYWIAGVLLAYYAAVFLIPVPGYGSGNLSFEGNLPGWIDRNIMYGRLLQQTYDELAVSTHLPASCLTVFGLIAGDILRTNGPEYKKIWKLCIIGVAAIVLGLIWNIHFPINKHMWSSSFILLTAGMSFLFMALFYWIIDVLGYTKWAFFFKVIGVNSLVIYFGYTFIDFKYTSARLFKGFYMYTPTEWHEVFQAFGALVLVWLFLYLLYRNKIFLKV